MAELKSLFKRGFILLFTLAILSSSSCKEPVLKRPFGDLRVGLLTEFSKLETYKEDLRLTVFHDQRGFAVMSTQCTFDLSPLKRVEQGAGIVYKSDYSESVYDQVGHVLHGPAIADLPFYESTLATGVFDGPRDTLYARIGKEVPREARLVLPN